MPYPVPWIGREIHTQNTFLIASPPCELIQIVVNTGVTSAVATVYDGVNTVTPSSNALKGTIDCSAVNNYFYGFVLSQGLIVVTSGANPSITVVYADYSVGGEFYGYYDSFPNPLAQMAY